MDGDNTQELVSSCTREEMNLPGKREGAPFCLAGVEVSGGNLSVAGVWYHLCRARAEEQEGTLV